MEMRGSGVDGKGKNGSRDIILLFVNTLKDHLKELKGTPDETVRKLNRDEGTPTPFAAAAWLTGGTGGGISQGCPLSPPLPVKDSCSDWRIRVPHLPHDLKSKKGDGVTVFILDAFPERGVIARAARDAGDDNLLLRSVN